MTRTIPNLGIQVPELPGDLQVVTSLPTASVRLRGPRSVVSEIVATQVRVDLDVGNIAGPGQHSVEIQAHVPEGVWDVEVSPRQIPITVEQETTRQVTVSVELQGAGTASTRAQADPEVSEASVTGPESAVSRVAEVVAPVEITNQNADFDVSVTPIAVDAEGQRVPEVSIRPETIDVAIDISARGKSVAVIPQLIGEAAQGYEVVDRQTVPPTVLVDGPQDLLNNLVAVQTEPVDISGVTTTVSRRARLVGLPEGIRLLEPSDGFIDVVVAVRQRGVRQPLPGQTVAVVNLEPGLVAEVAPPEIVVQVVAPEDVLADLPGSEVEVQVDASGLGAGVHTLQPKVALPPNVQWISTDPSTVVVTISEAPGTALPRGTPATATPQVQPSPQSTR